MIDRWCPRLLLAYLLLYRDTNEYRERDRSFARYIPPRVYFVKAKPVAGDSPSHLIRSAKAAESLSKSTIIGTLAASVGTYSWNRRRQNKRKTDEKRKVRRRKREIHVNGTERRRTKTVDFRRGAGDRHRIGRNVGRAGSNFRWLLCGL